MHAYFEHPWPSFVMVWASWLLITFIFSLICIPLSLFSKAVIYTHRISRVILLGTIPLIVLFCVSQHFDLPESAFEFWLGLLASCFPAVFALIAILISRAKQSSIANINSERWKEATMALSTFLVICLGLIAYLLWQNYWWKLTVDSTADEAGASQAISSFGKGHLVLWEIVSTNDTVRFSGRHEGPFEVWLDDYHPGMPSPWQYSRRRLNEAHNAQMRRMYQHPEKFKSESRPYQKESNSEAEAVTRRFAQALRQFDVVPMVEELHPDFHQACYEMILHVAESESESDQKGLFKAIGVESLDSMRRMTPKAATVKFYQLAFSDVSAPAKKASLQSKIEIVGSLTEDDMVHVLYRTVADVPELNLSVQVPSIVTLKRIDGKLKVLSTTQFDSVKAKLSRH